MNALVIAIDGPSGSGKSSVAREVASRLGLQYQDTGAMYRALTWVCLTSGVTLTDVAAVEQAAQDFIFQQASNPAETWVRAGISVDSEQDVTEVIREPRISENVSIVANNLGARKELIRRQRQAIIDADQRMVVEGRDITTVVAPDAQLRILLTASEQVRLQRRGLQLGENTSAQGKESAEDLRRQVVDRDQQDAKVASFQSAADGVITIDSSDLDLDQTVDAVLELVPGRR